MVWASAWARASVWSCAMRTEAEAFDDQPEYEPAFNGDLSPEETAYLAYIEEYNAKLKPLAEWELRDWREERMEDFINFLRNRAR